MQQLDGVGTIKIEEVEHNNWKAVRICNDAVQMVVVTEVGPRIISFGFLGMRMSSTRFPSIPGKGGDEIFSA